MKEVARACSVFFALTTKVVHWVAYHLYLVAVLALSAFMRVSIAALLSTLTVEVSATAATLTQPKPGCSQVALNLDAPEVDVVAS